jgi:23S rRNA (uracil1939-C5)-methyltransferase
MNEPVELVIEKLVHGGQGLGRMPEGHAVFVSGVLPGERVLVEIARKRKGVFQARLREVLSPSPDRTDPPCQGEKECTGATWPHIAYPAQLRFKTEILIDTLKRIGGLAPEHLLPVLPSPKTSHYRLRTQFTVRSGAGKQRIGFFRPGSYELVEVESAFLLHPVISRILTALRGMADRLPALTEIHVNASPAHEAHVLFFTDQESYPDMGWVLPALQSMAPEVKGVSGFARKKNVFSFGRKSLTLEVEGLTLQVTEGNFFQVNWDQNRNMVRTVLDFVDLRGDETVLDLYCGIGNFALPLAKKAKMVVGVESGYAAIEDAKENAARNGIENTEFIADDLQKGLKTLIQRKLRADVIVLDPPRAGATLKTLERILAFVPNKIVYVSCNPATLARDLKFFALFGFRLDRLRPIDMFPYTYHIEAVAEMVRS